MLMISVYSGFKSLWSLARFRCLELGVVAVTSGQGNLLINGVAADCRVALTVQVMERASQKCSWAGSLTDLRRLPGERQLLLEFMSARTSHSASVAPRPILVSGRQLARENDKTSRFLYEVSMLT